MRIVHSMIQQLAFVSIFMAAVLMFAPGSWASSEPSDAIQKGETFLVGLFDTNMDLLPEYRGANVYWLFHDNYLAAKVLASTHPEMAKSIMAAIHREGIYKDGKIELIFREVEKQLPFHQYQLTEVRRTTDKIIRTESVTDRVIVDWYNYADLLLMACIAETNQSVARKYWDAAMRMWDGKGFLDAAARHDHRYSTFKLGLALIAAKHLSPSPALPDGLIDRLLTMQDDSGGWVTDYDATGKKIGLANVETTCHAILGLEATLRAKQSPTN